MLAPSFMRAPRFIVAEARSEPARSIRESFPVRTARFSHASVSRSCVMTCACRARSTKHMFPASCCMYLPPRRLVPWRRKAAYEPSRVTLSCLSLVPFFGRNLYKQIVTFYFFQGYDARTFKILATLKPYALVMGESHDNAITAEEVHRLTVRLPHVPCGMRHAQKELLLCTLFTTDPRSGAW